MRNERGGHTKPHLAIVPQTQWTARLLKQLSGGEVTGGAIFGAREVSYQKGQLAFSLLRRDGLYVVVYGDMSDPLERMTRSKPYRQVLGLRLANGRPLYVAWPEDPRDNRPRVVWGTEEECPYEAIDHEKLLVWDNAAPLYPAWKDSKVCVIRGKAEGKPYDEIMGQITVVGTRELYRAKLGKEVFLVWGAHESDAYEDISPPEFDGKEITAWAARSVRFYKLTLKVN